MSVKGSAYFKKYKQLKSFSTDNHTGHDLRNKQTANARGICNPQIDLVSRAIKIDQ